MTVKTHPQKLFRLLAIFVLAMCVAGLGPACMLIECNIRRTVTGQAGLPVAFVLEEGWPVLEDATTGQPRYGLTEEQRQGATVLLPPSLRLLGALWRGELEAASRLWETVAKESQPPVD